MIGFASLSRTRIEQIAGRVMRVAPGKRSARVLDYGGHGKRFGSLNFDFDEALAFDRRAREQRQASTMIEAIGRGGRSAARVQMRPDVLHDFVEDSLEVIAVYCQAKTAFDGRSYVLLHVITPQGVLSPWLGSAEYQTAVWKTKEILSALGIETRPPSVLVRHPFFGLVPAPDPNAPPFDFSVANLREVVASAPIPDRVIARRIRDRRGEILIAPCAFERVGRVFEFNRTPALTDEALRASAEMEPA